jgi:hypothetical protein
LEPRREKPGRKHSWREKDRLGFSAEEEVGTHSQQLKPQPEQLVQPEALAAPAEIALEAPRHLVWLLLREPSELNELEQRTLSFVEEHPVGKPLTDLVQSFVKLLRKRDVDALDPWLERSMTCGIPDYDCVSCKLPDEHDKCRRTTFADRNAFSHLQ